MKIGDKLICVKYRKNYTTHKVGYIYKVIYMTDNTISIGVNKSDLLIYRLKNSIISNYDAFYIFEDYFMDLSEIRRKKLKKLKNEI